MRPGNELPDCELDSGAWDQPVNAWTSLGYVAAGLIVALEVVRGRMPRAFAALAAVTAVEGVGSFLFHGYGGDAAQLLHDVPLLGMTGFIAGWHAGRLWGAAERVALAGLALASAAGAVLWATVSDAATNGVVGVLLAVLAASALAAWRRRLPRVVNAPMIAVTVLAVAVWFAGRTDSPLCDEDSWAQPHGLWHLLTALLVLAWADRAVEVAGPDRAPRLFRRATDRAIGLLAAGLALAFHRSIDVAGREHVPTDRPVLVVANHGNGFVDPIVVTSVLGRLPRFLAKAALWKVVVARPFLGFAGVLPVYRSSDGDRPGDNRSVFAECHRELARGATVAIFPEGTTGDRAGLDRVRAGAARIALGALSTAPDVAISPFGLAFENRIETRTRAAVMIGEPIAVAPFARGPIVDGEPERDDVAALTDAIREALERISPEFASVDEREMLRAAARATLQAERDRREATFGQVEMLARRLAAAPATLRASVTDAFRSYATRLQLIGIDDDWFRPAGSYRRIALSLVALVVLGSIVLTATLIHLPAILLVAAVTAAVHSTATKGTVRILVGLVAGLLTWIVAGALLADGWAAVAAGVAVAVEGAIAFVVWPPLVRAAGTLWARLRLRDRAGLVPPLLAERAELVAAVDAAAAAGDVHK